EARKKWLQSARDYAVEMWKTIGDGYDTPQFVLPALAELRDAEVANATLPHERIAAQSRYLTELRKVESALQNPKHKFAGNRRLTELATRTQRIETEVRLMKDVLAGGFSRCATAAVALESL